MNSKTKFKEIQEIYIFIKNLFIKNHIELTIQRKLILKNKRLRVKHKKNRIVKIHQTDTNRFHLIRIHILLRHQKENIPKS